MALEAKVDAEIHEPKIVPSSTAKLTTETLDNTNKSEIREIANELK